MYATTALGLTPSSLNTSSGYLNASTAVMPNTRERESDWPSAKRSFNGMGAGFGSSPADPVKAPYSASPYLQEKTPRPSLPFRIVLAEDNPGDVLLVRIALESENLDAALSVKKDGQEMLDWIEEIETGNEQCPDLILLDLNLPKYTGAVLLQKLRASMKCAEIPVVIVTSSDSPKDREVATRLGTGYFRKPSDFEEFKRLGGIVRTLVGR
jgi:CheY-like chemotaxis protein